MKNKLYFISIYYIYLSILEWIIHKYLMHSDENSIFCKLYYSKSHAEHHKQVKNNMGLYNNIQKYNGVIFGWNDLILLFIISYFPVYYGLKYLNFETNIKRNTIIILLGTCFFYGILWNTLHTLFHKIDVNIPITDGLPSINSLKKKNNPIIYWLYKNHTLHHLIKGKNKGNYNIVLPGADFIFKTYNNEINNIIFCKKNGMKEDKLINLCNNNYSINNFNLD